MAWFGWALVALSFKGPTNVGIKNAKFTLGATAGFYISANVFSPQAGGPRGNSSGPWMMAH